MTPDGQVIWTCLVDDILVNVRAGFNGWVVSVIDTRNDRVIRRLTLASRTSAISYATALTSSGPQPDPMPSSINY